MDAEHEALLIRNKIWHLVQQKRTKCHRLQMGLVTQLRGKLMKLQVGINLG